MMLVQLVLLISQESFLHQGKLLVRLSSFRKEDFYVVFLVETYFSWTIAKSPL